MLRQEIERIKNDWANIWHKAVYGITIEEHINKLWEDSIRRENKDV